MGKDRVVVLDKDVDQLVDQFLKENTEIDFNQLMNQATRDLIEKIKNKEISESEWDRLMKKSENKYKKTLSKL